MRVAFGEFVFDSDTRELLRGGTRVTLSPKAFQLLEVLIENRPRALAKSVLHDRLCFSPHGVRRRCVALVTGLEDRLSGYRRSYYAECQLDDADGDHITVG
jgi:DNA-binding response OmpR family regulator